jgi:hypothetical protein
MLKILGLATGVRVRFPPSALILKELRELAFCPDLPFWRDFARNFARKNANLADFLQLQRKSFVETAGKLL